MSETAGDRITVRCPCGTKLKVPRSSAGRRAKCPKCAQVFVVPKPESAAAGPPETAPPEETSREMEEPARPPRPAETDPTVPLAPEAAPAPPECPGCGAAMPAGTLLCVMCGYNAQTGQAYQVDRKAASRGGRLIKAAGSVLVGTLLSGVGAFVGAAIWFVVAMVTGYEVGWIAWGLGGLAGLGMYLGCRAHRGAKTGLIAAAMSVVGIGGAKLAVFGFLFYAVITGDTDNIDLQREFVAGNLAEEILDERGISDEAEREARWEEVVDEAYERVERMNDGNIRDEWARYRQEQELAAWQEGDDLRGRLADHEASRGADGRGLPYDDPRRGELYKDAFQKHRKLSGDQLEAAITEIEAWEAGGKWADADYVRDFLVYRHIDQAWEEQSATEGGEDADVQPTEAEWRRFYEAAVAEADAMSPEDRLARAQEIERGMQLEGQRIRLASHRVARRAEQDGLAYWDNARGQLYDEESARAKELAPEELEAAIAEVEAWEQGGKWSDPAYVRDCLIREEVRKANEESSDQEDRFDPERWRRLYEAGAAEVDAVPESQRAQRARQAEAEREKLAEQALADITKQFQAAEAQAADEEPAAVAGAFLALFATSMFGLMDLVFAGLAVVTAFRIGSRSSTVEGA